MRHVFPVLIAAALIAGFFLVNLIGLGAGPPFVGWLIDQLSTWHFADLRALGPLHAAIEALVHPGHAEFVSSCPGGVAPAGATPELAERCAHASALGTRQGILITLQLYFWAALHFFLASIGLDKMLRVAA